MKFALPSEGGCQCGENRYRRAGVVGRLSLQCLQAPVRIGVRDEPEDAQVGRRGNPGRGEALDHAF